MQEIATVYARSLFEVAKERGTLETVVEQVGEVADLLDGNREVAVFLFSPYFSTEEKKDALAKAVVDADESVEGFLQLLVEKHRMPAIFRIRHELERLQRGENRQLPVTITSAIELDDDVVRRITETIGEQTGRTVEVTSTVDPDVIGGLRLQVGNSILDATIRARLERLRKQVATAA